MQKFNYPRCFAALLMSCLVSGGSLAAASSSPSPEQLGQQLAFDRAKGNCLACHAIGNGESPRKIAPPLVSMKTRFPDKDILKKQIWDARMANPLTLMPPFGPHGILSEEEIDEIVDYVYTL